MFNDMDFLLTSRSEDIISYLLLEKAELRICFQVCCQIS